MEENKIEENILQDTAPKKEGKMRNILAQLDREIDAEWVGKYDRLISIGKYSPVDIVIEGIKACMKQPQYLESIEALQKDLHEESEQ
jgi:hypothetical protein